MTGHKLSWRRWSWRLLRLVLVIGGAGLAVYWVKFKPVPVIAHVVERGSIVAEVMGTGTLEAHIRATISPKISGLITAVHVDQGDAVQADQPLVQLDDSDLKRQVEIAQAELDVAAAALERLQADRARAQAVLDQARREHQRLADLIAANTASSVEYDRAIEALGVAEAELARADAAIIEGRKQIAAAELTREYHSTRLADATIKAPFDGLVVRRDRDPGDVVVPGSSILAVISLREVWVSAWVDETEMARLKTGQPARIVFRSEPDRAYPGEIARLGREADRETREFIVDVRARELPENWTIGQRAEVFIETARDADAVLVPAKFVVWKDGQPGVFVNQEGRAAWRTLHVDLRSRDMISIREGIQPGDTVIAPALATDSLTVGSRVEPR